MDFYQFFATFGFIVSTLISISLIFTITSFWKVFLVPYLTNKRIDLVKKFGSWAVVTGSTDGLGKAYARELASRGMNIVLVSRTLEKLEMVAAEIRKDFNVKTKIIVADFSEGQSVFTHVENELKGTPVGILVNNVVMNVDHSMFFDEMSPDFIFKTVLVNVATALMMTRIVLPQMKERKQGAIVNISSILELYPVPLFSTYTASKAFMRSFTYSLDAECKPYGITVQLLSPSFMKTNLTKFSDFLHQCHELYIPQPTTFVVHAVNTLGIAKHTTGFLPHEISYLLGQIFLPTWRMRQIFSIIIAKRFRCEYKEMQKKLK